VEATHSLDPAGVWGDVGGTAGDISAAVVGTAIDSYAGALPTTIQTTFFPALFVENDEESRLWYMLAFKTYGGYFGGYCQIDVNGDLGV
jgi:hypothetical protein